MGDGTQRGPVAPRPLCLGLPGMGKRILATETLPIPPMHPSSLVPSGDKGSLARPESRTSLPPTPPARGRATQKCGMVGRG